MDSIHNHVGRGSSPRNWVGVGQSSAAEPSEAGRAAAEAAIAGREVKLLVVFCSERPDLHQVLDAIKECSPHAAMISCSAAGEIAADGIDPSGIVVTAMGGEGFSLHTAGVNAAAKSLSRGRLTGQELVTHIQRLDQLGRALDGNEIQAHFQPIVDLRSARVIGVEALVRWVHPERGVVSPAEFLDLAEAGGHMRALTEGVIEFSTRAAGDWWHSGLGLRLSVNLSPSTFSEPDWKLAEFVAAALARTGLPAKALQFEVTEDALMANPEVAAETLKRLSELGATISIDDFGTGHSSLGRLKSLPIDELKIDRSFIFDLNENEEDRTIVRSAIHLAHQMGLQVVAEGVETEDSWRQLRSMGCERAQGFLIAQPLPAREVPAWLATWNQRARELRSTRRVRSRSAAAANQEPSAA